MVRLEDKIKQLCRVNNVTQKELYSAIGITDAGMRKIYARNSCDVTLLGMPRQPSILNGIEKRLMMRTDG